MFFLCYDRRNTTYNISNKEIQTKQMRNTNEIQTYTKKKRKSQRSDMEFVKNFTPADFQAKLILSISPNFNSFSKKKHKK